MSKTMNLVSDFLSVVSKVYKKKYNSKFVFSRFDIPFVPTNLSINCLKGDLEAETRLFGNPDYTSFLSLS